MNRAGALAAAAALVAGCPGREPPPPAPSCATTGSLASPASATDRWLLGEASRYPADPSLAARADELHRSQRARREAAWQVVARVLAPVPLAQTTGVPGATTPRFRTWYGSEDVNRAFEQLYAGLGPAGRASQQRFAPDALDAAFAANARYLTTLPGWTSSMLASLATSYTDPELVAGIGGIDRIAISPDAARHVLRSYPEILGCMAHGAPAPSAAGPEPAPQQLARAPVALAACASQDAGPFAVADGGTLTVAFTGDTAGAAALRVFDPGAGGAIACDAAASAGCTVRGPGAFTVRVVAQGAALAGTLDVEYQAPGAPLVACLDGPFPASAATVAQEWRRGDLGTPLPTYDTSAEGLARRLAQAGPSWGDGDGSASPTDAQIYTQRLASGATFELAGMHIRTRELDHWLNITLWWSDTPDADFGADRPDAIRALGGPWSHYKMCVVTDFDEQDPSPTGGFDATAPSLGRALAAVYGGVGAPTWCSNPYVDNAPDLAVSNCVGCHQHAMSGVQPGDVVMDPARYPDHGRTRVRNNVPADGCWDLDAGDHLGAVLDGTVQWWASMRM